MSEVVFKAKNLCKEYGGNLALDNLNMQINRGEIYGFIGENGAGKTTTIRMLTGIAQPTSGEIEIFGKKNPKELQEQRNKIGCIIESPALYLDMTAKQNLEVQRIQRRIKNKKCINEILEIVNLTDTGRRKAADFSLGMRQRLALGIALLGEPEFLILDEPTNGLDPMGIVELRELLKRLNKEKKITILISSHILSELHQMATCFGIIHKGKMIEQLTSSELDEKCKQVIRINATDTARAATVIENTLHTKKYEVCENGIIKLRDYLDKVETVCGKLIHEGVGVKEIALTGVNLEEYFTKVIGGKLNA